MVQFHAGHDDRPVRGADPVKVPAGDAMPFREEGLVNAHSVGVRRATELGPLRSVETAQ